MQKNMSDALGAVLKDTDNRRIERGCSANYLIAHADGEIIDIEATPNDYDYIYNNGTIAHTNHFLSGRLQIRDVGKALWPDSITRLLRMNRLLGRTSGEADVESIKAMLRDHFGYPSSICRHPNEQAHELEQIETAASVIIDLSERKMYATEGPPCQQRYEAYTFEAS